MPQEATSVPAQFCFACKTVALVSAFAARDNNRLVDDRLFLVMRCPSCGLGHTVPRLGIDELLRYYPREYYSLDSSLRLEEALRPFQLDRLRRILRYKQSGRLLDVGCGTGMFMRSAKQHGFSVEGLEISHEAANLGRKAWGLDIREGNVVEYSFADTKYDVITLGHTLEHVHNPVAVLNQLRDLLEPGGLLVVSVPNFQSLQARFFKSRWFHLDIPRHLFHFTPSVLASLVRDAGLVVLEVNLLSREHNWAGILGSVMRLSPPEEGVFHKFVRKVAGTPVAKGLAFIEAVLGYGGTFELYSIKQ